MGRLQASTSRAQQVGNHLDPSSRNHILSKDPDDVVIVAAYRTALTRGRKGNFRDVGTDYLLVKFIEALIKKEGIDPNVIEDIACANVLKARSGITEHRVATIKAGIPDTVPIVAVNRQCASGLMAIGDIANKIKSGEIDCGLALGVESMSKDYGPQKSRPEITSVYDKDATMQKCVIPMGITNENVAEQHNIPRDVQDKFAADSFNKAQRAQESGAFKDEILPIEAILQDKDGEKTVVVDKDEGIRANVTSETLSKLKAVFKENGTTHAGNSSQITDGAAGVLLMRRSLARSQGYPIVEKFVLHVSVGVPPEVMGIGPALAIPKVLEKTGLGTEDVDVYEINEAFAAQCLYSQKACNIPDQKLNINGGAIALGHPLGATGTRQYATILRILQPGQIGVTSMCIGGGMGAASVVVRE